MKKLLTLFLIPITVMAINACHPDDVYEEFGKPTDVVNPHPVYATDFSIATLGDLAEKLGLKLGAAFTKSEYFNNDFSCCDSQARVQGSYLWQRNEARCHRAEQR